MLKPDARERASKREKNQSIARLPNLREEISDLWLERIDSGLTSDLSRQNEAENFLRR